MKFETCVIECRYVSNAVWSIKQIIIDYCNYIFLVSSITNYPAADRETIDQWNMKSVIFEDVLYEVPEKRGFGE